MVFEVASDQSEPQFVTFKCSQIGQDRNQVCLQIINISYNILYDQQKAENQFLAMINACVSHEMRTPLNSIIAFNV